MKHAYAGIDVRSDSIRVAAYSKGAVYGAAAEPLPDGFSLNDMLSSQSLAGSVIHDAAKSLGVRRRACALILPPSDDFCITRRFTLPLMDDKALKRSLPFEFIDFIPTQRDRYIYDYATLRPLRGDGDSSEHTLDILATAVHPEYVETYRLLLRRAGLSLVGAVPPEFAYANLLRACGGGTPSVRCIVDVERSHSRVYIYSGADFETSCLLRHGSAQLDSPLPAARTSALSRCADEVLRTLSYFNFVNGSTAPSFLYICASERIIPALAAAFEDANRSGEYVSGLTVLPAASLVPAASGAGGELSLCAAAAGAAMNQELTV